MNTRILLIGLSVVGWFAGLAGCSGNPDEDLFGVDLVTGGRVLPKVTRSGTEAVAGCLGEPYVIRVRNRDRFKVQVEIRVDGIDAFPDRHYIVRPGDFADIKGFRDGNWVRPFHFTTVANSRAARSGDQSAVGKIEAIFSPGKDDSVLYHHRGLGNLLGRQHLGTAGGSAVYSPLGSTSFSRDPNREPVVKVLRYDDRDGLCRRGISEFCIGG